MNKKLSDYTQHDFINMVQTTMTSGATPAIMYKLLEGDKDQFEFWVDDVIKRSDDQLEKDAYVMSMTMPDDEVYDYMLKYRNAMVALRDEYLKEWDHQKTVFDRIVDGSWKDDNKDKSADSSDDDKPSSFSGLVEDDEEVTAEEAI